MATYNKPMKRALFAALLAALAVAAAGCGGTRVVGLPLPLPKSSSTATLQLHAILGARPIWVRLALMPVAANDKLVWLGFTPSGNPIRECPRPPCHKTPSPVVAYVDALGNGFDGWADVHPAREPASPPAVIRALRRAHQPARLVGLG